MIRALFFLPSLVIAAIAINDLKEDIVGHPINRTVLQRLHNV